MPEIVVMHCA
jgi:hypothetical protein